jgi:hypothetical protein
MFGSEFDVYGLTRPYSNFILLNQAPSMDRVALKRKGIFQALPHSLSDVVELPRGVWRNGYCLEFPSREVIDPQESRFTLPPMRRDDETQFVF